jgi:hypothetical protein
MRVAEVLGHLDVVVGRHRRREGTRDLHSRLLVGRWMTEATSGKLAIA